MGLTYFKRFRMEIDLRQLGQTSWPLAEGYRLVAWDESLVEEHAEVKYESFRLEPDSDLFPCLGELAGCTRLMEEISQKEGFLPGATWMVEFVGSDKEGAFTLKDGANGDEASRNGANMSREYCGTIQGVGGKRGRGSIQNVGITPPHRGQGLSLTLVAQALEGFRQVGLRRVSLEVTAQNTAAVKLYQRIGFRRVRTLYKAVEVVAS